MNKKNNSFSQVQKPVVQPAKYTELSDIELEVVAGGCVWGYNCGPRRGK